MYSKMFLFFTPCQVIHVDLAGEDSSDHKADFDSGRLSTLAVILIAIAGAVGLLLLTLAFCCVSIIPYGCLIL